MHQILSKLSRCFITIFIIVTCTSCKASSKYSVSEYLIDLAYASGISLSQEINDSFNRLKEWKIVDANDKTLFDKELTYEFLLKTICRLINKDSNYLYEKNWISLNTKDNDLVDKQEAKRIINKAVELINNPEIDNKFNIDEKNVKHIEDYTYSNNHLKTNEYLSENDLVFLENDNEYKKIVECENGECLLDDPSFEEIFNEIEIEGSNEIDFEESEIILYYDDEDIEETNYTNNLYELLASKRRTFNTKGFRVAYSFNSSGLDVRISKNADKKYNMFFDISLSNIKPTYKWKYKNGKNTESFFKVNFKLTNEVGVSCGKYERYYLDFKDLDSSSFLNKVKSSIKTSDDELECTIPICKIKTPIPNVPVADFCIDVVAKIYVSGKVEIVLYNNGIIGFESVDGNFRVIHDVDRDIDFLVGASARAVAGINFNLETAKYRLMDIEFDGGIRAAVDSTLHLYDSDGNQKEEKSDIPYSILQDISKDNNDVKICGDISLNWVFDIQLNTSKSLLYKYGLTYKKSILDTSDQVFNNLTHIENFQLVKKCTRKNKTIIKNTSTTKQDSKKILLKKYSAVVNIGEIYEIPISSLPTGYSNDDLIYYSNETSIATVKNGVVEAHNIGSTKIEIKTKDGKYSAYINILVSTG